MLPLEDEIVDLFRQHDKLGGGFIGKADLCQVIDLLPFSTVPPIEVLALVEQAAKHVSVGPCAGCLDDVIDYVVFIRWLFDGSDDVREEANDNDKHHFDIPVVSAETAIDAGTRREEYRFLPKAISASPEEFTVVTMNILAGELGRPKSHPHCMHSNLNWEDRKTKLFNGLRRTLPDLLLLQELQGTTTPCKHDHRNVLQQVLAKDGYELASYAKLTGAKGVELGSGQSKNKKKPHIGNAVFFRSHVWCKLNSGRINFAEQLALRCAENPEQLEHYCGASQLQVAAWARLRHAVTSQVVLAVSVHISANFKNPDTQVAQVDTLLAQLSTIAHDGDAVVIGGDFNSLPGSGVYELLSQGALEAAHPDAHPRSDSVPQLCGAEGFHTGIKLESAYFSIFDAEPELTTFMPSVQGRGGFHGAIDYIWYSPQTLQPISGTALHTPTMVEASAENGGLPNSEIPSDHIPLGLAFRQPRM